MRAFKGLMIHVGVSVLWPGYVGLLAFSARVGPWPRAIARPVAFSLMVFAWAWFAAALARFVFSQGGWAEATVGIPTAAARQVRRSLWIVIGGVLLFLLPAWLLQRGLIAAGDRPVTAPAICRLLLISFECLLIVATVRLTHRKSALISWLTSGEHGESWFARHHRLASWSLLGLILGILALDASGYGFTARRVSIASVEFGVLVFACGTVYWLILQAIDHHAWRWVRWGTTHELPGATDDLAGRLKRLAAWVVPVFGCFVGAWFWSMDLALVRTIGAQPILSSNPNGITIGDATRGVGILGLTFIAWRHLGAFFAVAIFPRMADDPGIRFAVLTLGRYAVLGIGFMASMTCLHLGLDKIGVGLAALGVGLGFGLQEIVSNFVSGIILLLERPIRVGDVVTVAGMSGKVERINIRATTIINADNQSLIVPNREFITANLVNWTHEDRIIRVGIPVGVVYGTDPDRVADLLLAIARNDADVLRNPVPSASMEGFGDWSMMFTLYVHVPDPSVSGRVKHRLCAEIQKRFKADGIEIPLPSREVILRGIDRPSAEIVPTLKGMRIDPGEVTPPRPRVFAEDPPCPAPAVPSHRGMDE